MYGKFNRKYGGLGLTHTDLANPTYLRQDLHAVPPPREFAEELSDQRLGRPVDVTRVHSGDACGACRVCRVSRGVLQARRLSGLRGLRPRTARACCGERCVQRAPRVLSNCEGLPKG